MEMAVFPMEMAVFPMENVFPERDCSEWIAVVFVCECVVFKVMEFCCIKNVGVCIKSDGTCIKNDGIFIKTDGVCI